MKFVLQPWHVAFVALTAWVNQRQQHIIEFQNAEVEALLKKLDKKRVLLTDQQRRLLAVKGKALGRKSLMKLTAIVLVLMRPKRTLNMNSVSMVT